MQSEAIRGNQMPSDARRSARSHHPDDLPSPSNQMQSQMQSEARDRTIRMTSRHLPEQVEQEGGIVRRLERVDIEVGQPACNEGGN
jgi:hypothetical protein